MRYEKYDVSKFILFVFCCSIFSWLISGIDENRFPFPGPDKLAIYHGHIIKFIEVPSKVGSGKFIDIQTENKIKRLWFTSPITRFWYVLKDNYPNVNLTVQGSPYEPIEIWGLEAEGKTFFTYNDRIQMAKDETNRWESFSIKSMIICLVLLIISFPYERRLQKKIAQQLH